MFSATACLTYIAVALAICTIALGYISMRLAKTVERLYLIINKQKSAHGGLDKCL